MGGLLKLILIFVIIYWLFKTVGKFFFNTLTNKEGQNPYQGNQQQKSREGSIHVDYNPKDKKGNHNDYKGGEYVDYEEVE